MFLFNKDDVYIGYSLEELLKVRKILEKEGIKYSYKVINHSGQWLGRGTRRGNYGSFGINMDYEKQYVVSVKKSDYENAKYLVNKACIHHITLHSRKERISEFSGGKFWGGLKLAAHILQPNRGRDISYQQVYKIPSPRTASSSKDQGLRKPAPR